MCSGTHTYQQEHTSCKDGQGLCRPKLTRVAPRCCSGYCSNCLLRLVQEQGNFAVKEAQELAKKGQAKQRRQRLLHALEMYTTAVDLGVNSSSQRSVYRSNRAHVHLLLANNGHALADAEAAIALDASNVKVGVPQS